MQEIENGRLVTAEHEKGCDRVFRGGQWGDVVIGEQPGCLGSLECPCGKMQVYMTPWTETDTAKYREIIATVVEWGL